MAPCDMYVVQLAAQDKGYTILALAQPFFEVPAGSWNLQLSSSKPLPALQDLPVLRVANFDGSYSENAKGCLCRSEQLLLEWASLRADCSFLHDITNKQHGLQQVA